MRAFMKAVMPVVGLVLTAGMDLEGAQAFELFQSSPEACLTKYGSVVPPNSVDSVRKNCQRYLFPPAPGAPALAHHTLAGEQIRQVAQTCAERFGEQARMADVDGYCRVFYYPTMTNPLVSTIKLPPQEAGGLY